MSVSAVVRSLIQALLDQHESLSQEEIQQMLGMDYYTVNRALNRKPNPVLGETPFARTDNLGPGGARFVWYAVRPENPLTQREFDIKTKTAHTQMVKTRDNLLRPAIQAGAVANGDGDALDQSLVYLDAAVSALDTARRAGDQKAEVLRQARANQTMSEDLVRQQAELDEQTAANEATRLDLEKRRKALNKAKQVKAPALRPLPRMR